MTLAVRQINYSTKVDDIDKRQAVGGVMEALNKEATYGPRGRDGQAHCRYGGNARGGEVRTASATAITKTMCWRDRQGAGKAGNTATTCGPTAKS